MGIYQRVRNLDKLVASSPAAPTVAVATVKPGDPNKPSSCFYCEGAGHRMSQCSAVAEDVRSKEIVLDNGRVKLPDGTWPGCLRGGWVVRRRRSRYLILLATES